MVVYLDMMSDSDVLHLRSVDMDFDHDGNARPSYLGSAGGMSQRVQGPGSSHACSTATPENGATSVAVYLPSASSALLSIPKIEPPDLAPVCLAA